MVYEKEVVLNIRHCFEVYEQEQMFDDNVPDDSMDTGARFEDSHIHLGSRQRGLKILSYERVLEVELGFKEFGDSLAQFLRDYTRIEVYGSDFEGDGFDGHQLCINWCKVSFFLPGVIVSIFDSIAGLPSLFVQSFI
jgi:hypothetical protein